MSFIWILTVMVCLIYITTTVESHAVLQGNLKRYTFLFKLQVAITILLVPLLIGALVRSMH